jgi:hypothetical protein
MLITTVARNALFYLGLNPTSSSQPQRHGYVQVSQLVAYLLSLKVPSTMQGQLGILVN